MQRFIPLLLLAVWCMPMVAVVDAHIGFELNGTHRFEYHGQSTDFDSSGSIALGVELFDQSNRFCYGIGMEYIAPRTLDAYDYSEVQYNYLALHGIAKYSLTKPEKWPAVLLVGHLGPSFYFANRGYRRLLNGKVWDTTAGLYGAFGCELAPQGRFVFSGLFRLVGGALQYDGKHMRVTQTNFALRVGYRL